MRDFLFFIFFLTLFPGAKVYQKLRLWFVLWLHGIEHKLLIIFEFLFNMIWATVGSLPQSVESDLLAPHKPFTEISFFGNVPRVWERLFDEVLTLRGHRWAVEKRFYGNVEINPEERWSQWLNVAFCLLGMYDKKLKPFKMKEWLMVHEVEGNTVMFC